MVRDRALGHGCTRFGDGECRDEEACIERGIGVIAALKVPDHYVRVGEDGGKGDGFRESTDG